jgi:catechol 2,3-dioxygenase-like lactoylglutathione lyase family enzyme
LGGVFRELQVNANARDVETSVRFYVDRFGFVETLRTPSTEIPSHGEVHVGSLVPGLASIDAAKYTTGLATGGGIPRAEVCLWTDDVDAVHANLIAQDVPLLGAPHDFLGWLRAAWVANPDGTPVEIVAEIRPTS